MCASHELGRAGGGPHAEQNPGQAQEDLPHHHPLILCISWLQAGAGELQRKAGSWGHTESQGGGLVSGKERTQDTVNQ